MIKKYQRMMDSVNGYIYNRIFVEDDDEVITKEILKRFPVYVCFYKLDTEMIEEFILQLVRIVRFTYKVAYENGKQMRSFKDDSAVLHELHSKNSAEESMNEEWS